MPALTPAAPSARVRAMSGVSSEVHAPAPQVEAEAAATRARRVYVPPRSARRGSVEASTLVSGEQCVFDPPPC